MLNINWIDNTEENLKTMYKDYVEQIEKDKSLTNVTSVMGLIPYKKPTTGVGENALFIKRNKKCQYCNVKMVS